MLATAAQREQLVRLFETKGVRQTYRKHDYIIRHGDTPPGVFYITSGLVKAYDITKYQEENLLSIRRTGEIFPLIWALTGDERQIIFQTLQPTVALRISRLQLLRHLESHPATLTPLLDMTVEMYRLHSERILNLEYRNVRERIISFLLTMYNRFGKIVPEGMLIEVPLRHQDIASSVNASRETTSRELSALERKGLLSNKQSLIILHDLEGLRKHLS